MTSDGGPLGDRRATPEPRASVVGLDAYDAPRQRTGFSAGALAWGAAVAWLTLPVYLVVLDLPRAPDDLHNMVGLPAAVVLVLGYSFLPVVLLGVPAGILVARQIRWVENQWWHVGAFALVGGVVGVLGSAVTLGAFSFAHVLPTALAAATGRAALWRRFTVASAAMCTAEGPTGEPTGAGG